MEAEKSYRYYSKVAGSKFIFADGHEIFFTHGFHDLKPETYQGKVFRVNVMNGNPPDPRNGQDAFTCYKDELDSIIAAGNPLLYVQGTQPQALPNVGADTSAKSEAEILQQDSILRGVPGKVTGDLNAGPITSNVNESTVDANLQKTVLRERQPSEAVQKARAEAALRGAASGTASSGPNK